MPRTKATINNAATAKTQRTHLFRLRRLPQLIAEAAQQLNSREDKKLLLGTSYDTMLKRIEDPAQLTLGELARLYNYSSSSEQIDENALLEYINTFIVEAAKDIH